MTTLYSVLTIAGSDSGGGAGIQADLKTITSLGCYGASAITALTAQNTTGVQAIHPCPPDFVEQQITSVLQDIDIDSIKTGMLYNSETIRAIVRALKARYHDLLPPIVCDPVCVSTSGHTLLQPNAIEVMIEELFPLATLITPNRAEAEILLSHAGPAIRISTVEDMISASSGLLQHGSHAVLLKGGHVTLTESDIGRIISQFPDATILRQGFPSDNVEILQFHGNVPSNDRLVVDVLNQTGGSVTLFVRPWIESTNTHGTGCTLSSALACELARAVDRSSATAVINATKTATAYVHLGILTAPTLGMGNGPLNHIHSLQRVGICKPNPTNPFPLITYLIENTAELWKAYVEHDFVHQLGMGTLDRKSFIHFIKQDYHYLRYYARAYGYLAAKSTEFTAIEESAKVVTDVIHEIGNHKVLCQHFDISGEELDHTPESSWTTAYGAYILDMGLQGDNMKLFMALIACLLGYGEVGLWLKREASRDHSWVVLNGNPYKPWMDIYSGVHYQGAVKKGLELVESRAAADPPSEARLREWLTVWRKCTMLEKGFWDMAINVSW